MMLVLISCSMKLAVSAEQDDSALKAGISYYQQNDLQKASEYFSEILQRNPDNAYANYYLGAIFVKIDDPVKAIVYLEKAAQSKEEIDGLDAYLSSVYVKAGMFEKALPYIRKQHEMNPGNEDVAIQYGKLLKDLGNEDKAIEVFQAVVNGGGGQVDSAKYYQGVIYTGRGMYSTAISLFGSVNPQSPYGDASKQYIDSLATTTKPLTAYLALDYFYNDNPESDAIALVPGQIFTGGAKKSTGINQTISINTRSFEAGSNWKANLGYLYYAIKYDESFAKKYDYTGNYIKPHVEYIFSKDKKINIDLKYSIVDFNQQNLSNSYSLAAQYYRKHDDGDSHYFSLGGQVDSYTDAFKSTPTSQPTSMKYKDAVVFNIDGGIVLNAPQQAGTVTLTGAYKECLPDNENDPLLGSRASDYRYREGVLGANLAVPFRKVSFDGTFNFSYRDYLNVQTGQLYNSAVGKNIAAVNLTFGAKIIYLINQDFGLRLTGGVERNESESQADELNTVSNNYFIQISGSF